MNDANIWCTPHTDGWQVKRTEGEQASSVHDTQEEAWEEAKRLGRRHEVECFLQGEDGRILQRNSYGNDPAHRPG